MTRMLTIALAMTLTILTACDYAVRKDIRAEQEDELYREAMNDYRAGRLDAAVAGFTKAIRKDPGNCSARFQLACLLQDAKHDFVGAYCGYREYLLLQPDSDKSSVAQERLAICEKELARHLATKHGLGRTEAAVREFEAVCKELKGMKTRVASAEKNLSASQARIRSLIQERDRLMKIVRGDDESAVQVAGKPSAKEVKDLLEETEETAAAIPDEAARLKAESDADLTSGSTLLPVQKPQSKPVATANMAEKTEKADKKPALPPRPKTYVVEDGDTLYAVAKRFYGTKDAWKRIREANKALISMDNRLRAGDTIVLP